MEFRVNYNFYEYGYSIETDDTAKHGLLQVMMQYKLRVSEFLGNFFQFLFDGNVFHGKCKSA